MKIRKLIYVFAFVIISCNDQNQKTKPANNRTSKGQIAIADSIHKSTTETYWAGMLNGRIPVFIHYQLDSNLIIGEIIYLNTKNRIPIRLLGTIEEDTTYRLLEFDKTGNITGVIEAKPTYTEFKGSWFSTKTHKGLDMKLVAKDTLLKSSSIKPDSNSVYGNYSYQYGERGYNGEFDFTNIGNGRVSLYILSLTNIERGPNIAEIEQDTIAFSGDNFIYKLPGSTTCEFKVTFYKGFACINYVGDHYCDGQFGLNATIDGIYLKTK